MSSPNQSLSTIKHILKACPKGCLKTASQGSPCIQKWSSEPLPQPAPHLFSKIWPCFSLHISFLVFFPIISVASQLFSYMLLGPTGGTVGDYFTQGRARANPSFAVLLTDVMQIRVSQVVRVVSGSRSLPGMETSLYGIYI